MTPSEKNIVKSLVAVAWADGTVKEPEAGMIDSHGELNAMETASLEPQ